MRTFCTLIVLLTFASSPMLSGQTRDGDWKRCRDSNPDVAIRGCTAIIESGRETDQYQAIALNRRGNAYQDKKDDENAIKSYREAIRLNPSYSLALNNRGNIYLREKDYAAAIKDYDEDIRLEPTSARAFIRRGAAYMNKLDFDPAIRDFSEAIRLDPGDVLAFKGRATANLGKKDYDHALEDFEVVTRLDPGEVFGLDGEGMVRDLQGDYDDAIHKFDEAIRLNPGDEIAFDQRGNAYRHKDDFGRAIQDYSEAIRLKPGYFDAFDDRGFLEFELGQFALAQSDFLAAQKLRPSQTYESLWLYLARSRSGQDGRIELETNAAQAKLTGWPGPVLGLYLGKVPPAAVLAAASDPDPQKNLEQHCEAYFYLGEQALLQEKRDEAKRLFQQAVDTGIKSFYEYTGSEAELKRMQASDEDIAK